MTTLIYDRRTKTIGVDSRNTDSSDQVFTVNKIELLSDGRFFLGAGHNLTIAKARGWAEVDFDEDQRPDFEELFGERSDEFGMSCLIISKDGDTVWLLDDEMVAMEVEDEVVATGSGGHLAKGAVLAGASVLEAVEIAIEHDPNSGGPARVFVIGEDNAEQTAVRGTSQLPH